MVNNFQFEFSIYNFSVIDFFSIDFRKTIRNNSLHTEIAILVDDSMHI